MKTKKIIITGCAGMIAWHLINFIYKTQPDVEIIGFDYFDKTNPLDYQLERINYFIKNKKFTFYNENIIKNINIDNILKSQNIDTIINLAGSVNVKESFIKPEYTLFNNYNSFLSIVESVRTLSQNTKIIYASSSSVYGYNHDISSEDSKLNPLSAYAYSKLQNEQIAEIYSKQYNLSLIGLRFFTVCGEYNRKDMFIYKILKSIKFNEQLNLYNKGLMYRDFTYAGDIAKSISYLLNDTNHYGNNEIYNIGTGNPISLLYTVKLIEEYMQCSANIKLIDDIPPYDPLITFCDNKKIKTHFPDLTFTESNEFLFNIVNWYKNK